MLPDIASLGVTQSKDIVSFCLALTVDPIVNSYKPRHCVALEKLASCLQAGNATEHLKELLKYCADSIDAHPEVAEWQKQVCLLLVEKRILLSFLAAVSSSSDVFERLRLAVADVLLTVSAVVKDYHETAKKHEGTAAEYMKLWGDPNVSPDELRRRFLFHYPDASDDTRITGSFFPGLPMCRPEAFACAEVPELGTCAKNYEEAHQHFSPGAVTICCACAHPKVIGFVILDKKEGPPALLNAILSHFALLPYFVVYDFGCGALRSALGKLSFFIAIVILVSDLFHIVNHLCTDALHPKSYSGLDGANTVAHEQRNAPINLMRRTLRACGQDEYVSVLQLENIMYNIMAHARSTSPCRLREDYNFRQFYFSRNPCSCGCAYSPSAPAVPIGAAEPDAFAGVDDLGVGQWAEGDDW